MAGPPPLTFGAPQPLNPTARQRTAEATADKVEGEAPYTGRRSKAETERAEIEAGYAAPRSKVALTGDQLALLSDLQANARDELKTFEALDVVKTYDQGMRYFAVALTVPVGRAGDQDLVTLAAKVQDPTGAVMQGDVNRYNDLQTALQYIPQQFRDQFTNEGKFSPELRREIIAFMRNRVNTYRAPYKETRQNFERRINGFNQQIEPLGLKPVDANDILPGDPLALYQNKIEAYDKGLLADEITAKREADDRGINPLLDVPEGMQVAGEDIKGWRFTPEAEADIIGYIRKPDATAPEAAKLATARAVAEGHIAPENAANYEQSMLASLEGLFSQPPEARANVKGISYREIDKAASENAGVFDSFVQAVKNTPESAYQLAEGLTAIPKDLFISAVDRTRTGTTKLFTDLAMELGGGDLDGPTVNAIADVFKERYGSMDQFQRTAITDPIGVLGDVSLIMTAGGSAGARAPGVAGNVGRNIATVGKMIDPLSGITALATEGLPALYRAAEAAAPDALRGATNAPSELLGFPSGVGGAPLREAASAGFERGVAGAPTPRSEAFTEGMRSPETVGEDLVNTARAAVSNMREQASVRYKAAMAQFGQNPTPLSIDNVRQRMAKIKPSSYDTWAGRDGPRPSDHLAWERMNGLVEDYAAKAAADPSLLLPLQMDQFKQDLFDVGSKGGGAYDRDAARIASTAYNAVRQELVKHDPIYADTMREYESVAKEAQQLESTFGLAAARGKQVNIEGASRKLQAAIGRNNATVAYGQRSGQLDSLNALDPDGTIMPTLAGTTLSSPRPRGLNAAVGLGLAGFTVPSMLTNPLLLGAVPPFVPRAMGELAYGGGQLVGTGARLAKGAANSPLGQSVGDFGRAAADLYQRYPSAALAVAQTGTRAEEAEAELNRELLQRYQIEVPSPDDIVVTQREPEQQLGELAARYETPNLGGFEPTYEDTEPAPAETSGPKGGDVIVVDGRDAVYDPTAKAYLFVDDGEIARMAMRRGGKVKRPLAVRKGKKSLAVVPRRKARG